MQLAHAFAALKTHLSPICSFCHQDRACRTSWLCTSCRSALSPLPARGCASCGAPFYDTGRGARCCTTCEHQPAAFTQARSLFFHKGILREKILAYKYGGQLDLESIFQEMIGEGIARHFAHVLPQIACIVPMPPDPKRGPARGYNPPLRWSLRAAQKWNIPVSWHDIGRKPAPPQAELSFAERRENTRHLFYRLRPGSIDIEGKGVLVIDDVWTTGSTVRSLCRFLKAELKPADIFVMTLARR